MSKDLGVSWDYKESVQHCKRMQCRGEARDGAGQVGRTKW